MASSRKQLITLACLLLVLAVVLWWQSRGVSTVPPPAGTAAPRPVGTQATTPAPAAAVAQAARGTAKVPAVALTRLHGERPAILENGRDPFRFGSRPRPSPVAPPSAGLEPGSRAGGFATERPPSAPAGPPPAPPIAMKFIGIVKRSEAGIVVAVLSDGKGVYYGAEGDVIEGRYRIVKIGNESIELTYLDGRGRQRIPLSGA